MDNVLVVTDSNANIPPDLVRELDIRVVPLLLNVGGNVYKDGVDITPAEIYSRQREQKVHVKTSSPSVADFLQAYTAKPHPGRKIVSIHLPARLSGTLEVARTASRLIDDADIRVVDAQSVAIAQGFVVMQAARTAKGGGDMQAVIDSARRLAGKVRFFAMLDTLEYLHRGGRIGGVQALMGMLLNIKPVVHLVDGRVEPLAKTRTRARALEIMLDILEKEAKDSPIHAAVLHTDEWSQAKKLRDLVDQSFECKELFITELTPVMGAHSGPGVLGLSFYVE